MDDPRKIIETLLQRNVAPFRRRESKKISCGNKTDRGRRTWQILASLSATCVQRGHDLIDYLTAYLPLTVEKTG